MKILFSIGLKWYIISGKATHTLNGKSLSMKNFNFFTFVDLNVLNQSVNGADLVSPLVNPSRVVGSPPHP